MAEILSLTNGRMFPLSVQDGKSGVNGPVDIVGVGEGLVAR
jgi:hypothetical protein